MQSLDWAQLKGEGNKIKDFALSFVNEMVKKNIKCYEIPSNLNEISLKIKSNPFLIGEFHTVNKNGDLLYRAFLKDNNKLFFGIMGLLFVIGLPIGLIMYFTAGFAGWWYLFIFAVAIPVWWFFIAGRILGELNKAKKVSFPSSLNAALADIRSI